MFINYWKLSKLCTKVKYEKVGIVLQQQQKKKPFNLDPRTHNQPPSASQNLDDFYDHFVDTVSDTVDYYSTLNRKYEDWCRGCSTNFTNDWNELNYWNDWVNDWNDWNNWKRIFYWPINKVLIWHWKQKLNLLQEHSFMYLRYCILLKTYCYIFDF